MKVTASQFLVASATVVTLIIVSGCCITHPATPSDIVRFADDKQRQGAVQDLLWYQGRFNGRDYFKYVYGMFAERCFSVLADQIPLHQVIELTDDSARWILVSKVEKHHFRTYE